MIDGDLALKNIDTLNNTYYHKINNVYKSESLFPYQKLSHLFFELNIGFYLERTYCLQEVLKFAYFHYDTIHLFKLKTIYREVSNILGKNVYTLQSNVRLCIQDIIDNAPDEFLHSVFYIDRKEANKNVNPKYFIVQILDYLNNDN